MKKEEVLKFYQNYRLYIFPAIVVLSSLIIIIFVIYPQTIKLITNQKTGEEIANKSKLLEVKAQALESYDSEDLSKKVDFALSSYPTEKDFVSALGSLQNLTFQSGFSTVSMSLGSGSSAGTNSQSFNIKLDVLGPTTSLSTLLNNIESSSRLMRVSNMETSTGKSPQEVAISFSVDVLYSSAPTEFGSVDSPLPELSNEEETIVAKLAARGTPVSTQVSQPTAPLGARGKENPFE